MATTTAEPAQGITVSSKGALFGSYKRVFLNPINRDRYFLKTPGGWIAKNSPVQDRFFHDHLTGSLILGAGYNEASGIVCFDIDNHNGDQGKADQQLNALVATIEKYTGKLPIIEQSRKNGGYHVFIPLMNGKYPEYGEKIRRFADHLLNLSGYRPDEIEVFGAGCKTGNLRQPFSKEYNLINPFTGQPTGATGYRAIALMNEWIRAGAYIQNYRIDLDAIPAQINQRGITQSRAQDYEGAMQIYRIMRKGLTAPGQRIRTLGAIFWYLVVYQDNPPERAIRDLEYWIQTKHNGKSRDINANYKKGIADSIEYIQSLARKDEKYTGTPFYFQSTTGIQLSPDARLLVSHLLCLVHRCAVKSSFLSATSFKQNGQYFVSIPYANTVRNKMEGFKRPNTGRPKLLKAELELEARGLIYRDKQLKVFLPNRNGSPCTHLAVNVQALFGYRSGRDAWTKYQDKLSSDRVFQWLQDTATRYTQKEIAQIVGTYQQKVSEWLRKKQIPRKYHFALYELRQI